MPSTNITTTNTNSNTSSRRNSIYSESEHTQSILHGTTRLTDRFMNIHTNNLKGFAPYGIGPRAVTGTPQSDTSHTYIINPMVYNIYTYINIYYYYFIYIYILLLLYICII